MSKIIKISKVDDLKIIKSPRKPLLAQQIHKNKKAYLRQAKHKKIDY